MAPKLYDELRPKPKPNLWLSDWSIQGTRNIRNEAIVVIFRLEADPWGTRDAAAVRLRRGRFREKRINRWWWWSVYGHWWTADETPVILQSLSRFSVGPDSGTAAYRNQVPLTAVAETWPKPRRRNRNRASTRDLDLWPPDWHQNLFTRFQSIVFTCLVTDERTDGQTDKSKTLCSLSFEEIHSVGTINNVETSQVSHHRPCRGREACHRLGQGKSGRQRGAQRQTGCIKEALWIKKTLTCMNLDAGSYQLSHTWDQVISRSRAPSSCKHLLTYFCN